MADLLGKYGRVQVARMVQAFYREVLESPRLSGYFAEVDMQGLVAHQTIFMRAVLGEEAGYTREQIRAVHGPLDIGRDDFEEMLGLLHAQLAGHGFESEDAGYVVDIYRSYQGEVTTAG